MKVISSLQMWIFFLQRCLRRIESKPKFKISLYRGSKQPRQTHTHIHTNWNFQTKSRVKILFLFLFFVFCCWCCFFCCYFSWWLSQRVSLSLPLSIKVDTKNDDDDDDDDKTQANQHNNTRKNKQMNCFLSIDSGTHLPPPTFGSSRWTSAFVLFFLSSSNSEKGRVLCAQSFSFFA